MPAEHIHDGKTIYICTVCGLGYDDILIAYACEEYFRQYGESSTDIVKKAIYRSDTTDPLLKRAVAK